MRYFDYNATSPLLPAAREAWLAANEEFFGNASSPHRIGARADRALEEARERLGRLLGCRGEEIVFTSGATESNNLALHHIATSCRDGELWLSAIEHPSALRPGTHRFEGRYRMIPVGRDGMVDLDWIADELRRKRPALIAVMAANNETGVLQRWREVAAMCREVEVPFMCDAVQWVGKELAAGLGSCDFVSGSAHKFGGPKGVGFLKIAARTRLEPLLLGGKQEWGGRAGTENVPGVLGMMAALEARADSLAGEGTEARLAWRGEFERSLLGEMPGCEIIGQATARLWNTVSVLMPERDCRQRWVVKLDKLGFAVSTGSACASGQEQPSHVLTAMGYSGAEAGRMLRFSSGWETTREDWMALRDAVRMAYHAALETSPAA